MAKARKPDNNFFVRSNERIRILEVLLIHEGQNLGVMKTQEALEKAREVGLDLVEVSPNSRPPVCQIMDYGKFMYERNKKKKQHIMKDKEVSFRYVIDDHDLETKANQIRKFIGKGHKVKVVVKFKAREKAHKDKGFVALNKLITMLGDAVSVEKPPGFEGHCVTARLDKKDSKDGSTERKTNKDSQENP